MHPRFLRAMYVARDRPREAKLAHDFLIFPPAKAFNEREKRKEIENLNYTLI